MPICVSVYLSYAAFPHCCMDPDVTWGNGRGCSVVVHYWADLQLVHGFRCCYKIVPNVKCQQVFVLAVCLVNTSQVCLSERLRPECSVYTGHTLHLTVCCQCVVGLPGVSMWWVCHDSMLPVCGGSARFQCVVGVPCQHGASV